MASPVTEIVPVSPLQIVSLVVEIVGLLAIKINIDKVE